MFVTLYVWAKLLHDNVPEVFGECLVCCTCRKGVAEVLPFPDGSVDLLTAASAAHWFDQSRFLVEASRVLKPRGCMALLGFSDSNTRLHYQNCGERLTHIYEEVGVDLV